MLFRSQYLPIGLDVDEEEDSSEGQMNTKEKLKAEIEGVYSFSAVCVSGNNLERVSRQLGL